MMFNYLLLVGVTLPVILGAPQNGFNGYTTYEPGNMSIIITSPHDGSLNPSTQFNGDSWPERTDGCKESQGDCVWTHNCGTTSSDCDARIFNDQFTYTIAQGIADKINSLTGVRPHVVYSNLMRRKLDANREVNEASLNIPDAITAYNDYNNFILDAKSAISGSGLLLDIHGQTHTPSGGEWIELGYTISRTRLNDGNFWKTLSSVEKLGINLCDSYTCIEPNPGPNHDNPCFKDLIRGSKSLGHFLNVGNLRAVPSPNDPSPGSEGYYAGGYTMNTHGSKYGGDIDGIQLEFPRLLREDWPNDQDAVVSAILCFYKTNYDTSFTLPPSVNCS